MRSLLDLDKTQLHRIDEAIAALASQPNAEREKRVHLLRALESERRELVRSNPAIRSRLSLERIAQRREHQNRQPGSAPMVVAAGKAEDLVEAE